MSGDAPVSRWVSHWGSRVPAGAPVLDLACGRGRHARHFAALGHPVLAVDRDLEALALLDGVPNVQTLAVDLETSDWPLAGRRFGAVVVANYLYRPHLARLAGMLDGGGLLIYETFAVGNEIHGRPSNPAFLLRPGELLAAFPDLRVLGFEQGRVEENGRTAVLQRICAQQGVMPTGSTT